MSQITSCSVRGHLLTARLASSSETTRAVMSHPIAAGSTLAPVLLLVLVSGASSGCGGSSGGAAADGGRDSSAGRMDASVPEHVTYGDAAQDSRKDSAFLDSRGDGPTAPSDAGPTPPAGASHLVNTVKDGFIGVQLVGITEDDKNVVFEGLRLASKTGVYVVPLAGGSLTPIVADLGTGGSISIVHNTVFVWSDVKSDAATGNGRGRLTVWTEAKGAVGGPASSVAGLAAASADSARVAYTSNVSSSFMGELLVAGADLSSPTKLLSSTETSSSTSASFNAQLQFVSGYLLMSHQEGSPKPVTISAWDTTAWGKTDLIADINATAATGSVLMGFVNGSFWTSTMGALPGSSLLAVTTAGALELVAVAGGIPQPIDTGVTSFYMTADSSLALYGTSGGAFKKQTLPFTTASPTTILASGFDGIVPTAPLAGGGAPPVSVSADNAHAFFSINPPAGLEDINLVSVSAGATPISLVGSETGAIFLDPFTADSTFGLYYANAGSGWGDLWAMPVSSATPSSAVIISASGVWQSNYLTSPTTGTKIVYNDDYVMPIGASVGVADIKTVDVRTCLTTCKPSTVMLAADSDYYVTTDHKAIVFSLTAGNAHTDGIYAYVP